MADEVDWLALAQPTEEPARSADEGPWWVEDKTGHQFASYVKEKGLKVLKESPFNRNGELRAPEPGGVSDSAQAVTEGESR